MREDIPHSPALVRRNMRVWLCVNRIVCSIDSITYFGISFVAPARLASDEPIDEDEPCDEAGVGLHAKLSKWYTILKSSVSHTTNDVHRRQIEKRRSSSSIFKYSIK